MVNDKCNTIMSEYSRSNTQDVDQSTFMYAGEIPLSLAERLGHKNRKEGKSTSTSDHKES